MDRLTSHIWTLATLPVAPGGANRPLTLAYTLQQGEGRFTYGEAALLMDYRATITRATQGSRDRKMHTTEQFQAQSAIPCTWLGSWLIYGANWPEADRFVGEPFSYDPATGRWHTQYVRYTREAIFHDVHTTTIIITLAVDLIQLQGWYTCTETYATDD